MRRPVCPLKAGGQGTPDLNRFAGLTPPKLKDAAYTDAKQKIAPRPEALERGANSIQIACEPYRPPLGENQLREGEGGDPVGVGALHIGHAVLVLHVDMSV